VASFGFDPADGESRIAFVFSIQLIRAPAF